MFTHNPYLFSILSNTQTSNVTSSQQSQQSHPFLAKSPQPPSSSINNTAVVYATQVEKGTSTATITPTANALQNNSVTHENEAPKSPPKWPLRPGVMVHVKTDTKENLHAARTQSPVSKAVSQPKIDSSQVITNKTVEKVTQETTLNQSTISAPELPPKNPFRVSRCDSDSLNNTTKSSTSDKTANNTINNDELVKFSNSKLLERILIKLKLRRAGSCVKEMTSTTTTTNITEDETDEDTGDGSSFKRRNDYRFRIQSKASWRGTWDTWAWFGSNKSTRSNKNLVDNNNHITGIECTEKGNHDSHKAHINHNFKKK